MAGNGTIGLELLEDLPDVDTVLIPYGGGGLTSGIASAVKALRPEARVFACEPETAAPSPRRSPPASRPRSTTRPRSSTARARAGCCPAMWPLVREVLDGALRRDLDETAAAIRLLAERVRVIAEGAGALAPAAALSGRAGGGTIACIVSGGNIDVSTLTEILAGETPGP